MQFLSNIQTTTRSNYLFYEFLKCLTCDCILAKANEIFTFALYTNNICVVTYYAEYHITLPDISGYANVLRTRGSPLLSIKTA